MPAAQVMITIPLTDLLPHISACTNQPSGAPNANTVSDRHSGLHAFEVEIDAADLTAENTLKDLNSEGDDDEEEEEGDDPWDLGDNGELACPPFRCPTKSDAALYIVCTRQIHAIQN